MKKLLATIILSSIAVTMFVLLSLSGKSTSEYKITHPVGDKQHAIIQIRRENGYTCSAFVVDDTRAVTAGHCTGITEYFMATKYKAMMKESYQLEKEIKAAINGLQDCPLPQCKMMIQQAQMELNLELEAREKAKKFKVDKLKVYNIYGEDTGIIATSVWNNMKGRDHGVIRGNFKNFEKLVIAQGFDVKRGDVLRTCGYAGSKNPPICTDFTAIANAQFMYFGEGYVVRGMSGGPVIDANGEVVGINSAVPQTGVVIDTLVGMFNRKFYRPKKKIKKKIKLRAKDR